MLNDSFRFLAVLGGGKVELKVIVKTKYQTKGYIYAYNKILQFVKEMQAIFMCGMYMCTGMCAAQLN